jgi:hypothetical protein
VSFLEELGHGGVEAIERGAHAEPAFQFEHLHTVLRFRFDVQRARSLTAGTGLTFQLKPGIPTTRRCAQLRESATKMQGLDSFKVLADSVLLGAESFHGRVLGCYAYNVAGWKR